jgi:hypothetical protein
MALRYFIYGEVVFTTTAKRTAAGRRLDQRAAKAGFEPAVWQMLVDVYGAWPAGRGDITKDGSPAMRFCYTTLDPAIAAAAQEDIAAAWDVFQDSDSFWSYTAVPE